MKYLFIIAILFLVGCSSAKKDPMEPFAKYTGKWQEYEIVNGKEKKAMIWEGKLDKGLYTVTVKTPQQTIVWAYRFDQEKKLYIASTEFKDYKAEMKGTFDAQKDTFHFKGKDTLDNKFEFFYIYKDKRAWLKGKVTTKDGKVFQSNKVSDPLK